MRPTNKFTWLIVTLGLLISTNLMAGVIVLEGNYQGKNLYVQNPFTSSGVGFCTTEVTVNGQVTTDEINSSAFEIDFTAFNLELGTSVVVKIKYKENCKPKVLNPEVLRPRSTYQIASIKVDSDNNLVWTTRGESGSLPFVIEQYRWNKWIKLGEVDGVGTATDNSYKFKLTPHSGINKVRIKQVDYSGKPKVSQPVSYRSNVTEVVFEPLKPKEFIFFKDLEGNPVSSRYEIYDRFGNLKKTGVGKRVNVANLEGGEYYISFDNTTKKFIKR